jgi:LAO/AO transport system kinase
MYESINEHLKNSFYYNPVIKSTINQMEKDVLGGQITSFVAAKKLLDTYYATLK